MKKKKKASNNRLMFFGVISIFIIAFFVFNFFKYVMEVKNLNDKIAKTEKELSNLKQEEDNLKNEIIKLKDSDYLARYARENYMYSKEGEYIIKVNDIKQEEYINKNDDSKSEFIIITILVSSVFLGIIIVKKIFL